MCGIAGYLSPISFNHQELLHHMGLAIEHRGPDASGIWFDNEEGIGFCHRRLSILDLSEAGAQPMVSNSGRYVIVFNGEIYNFLELKKELDNLGSLKWRGHSDTEIILCGFEKWGIEPTIKKLIGMFAIAVWDKHAKELFLIRDRMGEKPLYFGWQGETLLFASELKAIRKHPSFKNEVCLNALGKFFKYNYVPSGESIYKGIAKLQPGAYCKISLKQKAIEQTFYWRLDDYAFQPARTNYNTTDKIEELEHLLKDAIGKQMISDVPLGAFLSGGVDSSTIVALMQAQSSRPVKTFSIGFNERGFDEAVYAKKVAQHLGTDHTELYVSAEETRNVIPYLPEIYDEPFSDSSQIPTYLVSKLAKAHVTVSLSGDAGDELFSGYNRYIMVNNLWSKFSKIPLRVRSKIGRFLLKQKVERLNAFYARFEKVIPSSYKFSNFGDKMHKIAPNLNSSNNSELYDSFISHWNINDVMKEEQQVHIHDLENIPGLSFIEKMMFIDSKTYLPDDILVKVDRAAMANSLEARVPFLDHRIVEFAWSLPMDLKLREGKGKWLLREVLYKHVPKELIERPKMGFGIPLDEWLKGPLKEWAFDLLSPENLKKHGFLNVASVQRKLEEHASGKRDWQYHLWDVLMFQSWYEKYQ